MLGRLFLNSLKKSTAAVNLAERTTQNFRSSVIASTVVSRKMSSSDEASNREYETLNVKTVAPFVTHVTINRPEKLNAMNQTFWGDIRDCFRNLHDNDECRAIVLSGAGRLFTAGLDFSDMTNFFHIAQSDQDLGRKAKLFYKVIREYQDSFSALEKCQKPVIAAIHGACIGGGVDLISSADIRYCTKDAFFQIKEVDLGLAADVGTLQRLPKVVGNDSVFRELAYSCRKMPADEAKSLGLVGRVFDDHKSMMEAALELASVIAEKSPIAVQGTKINLNYSRDHTADESLEYMARWNSLMLQSEDLVKAVMALMSKEKPTFSKL